MASTISDRVSGLSTEDVQARIQRGETNDFAPRAGRSYWQIIQDNILNVFNITLFTLLGIVLVSRDYATVFFAGFSVLTNTLLGTVQEIQAKRKLDQLAELAAKQVTVLRNGQEMTIATQAVVRDDVIILRPGDQVVVDGEVIQSDSLEIDESQVTGESEAVYKATGDAITSGSFCVAGAGIMRATKVGERSTLNRLSTLARAYRTNLTPTQRRIAAIVRLSLLLLTVLGPMIFIAGFVTGEPFFDIIRHAIVFITTLVPQGLILSTILALTIGAVKISRHQTLIQRVNAVESLGNATVLCFDKTGTITYNRLAVHQIIPLNGDTPERIHDELRTYTGNLAHHNSTAAAIARYVTLPGANHLPQKLHEISFNSVRKWGAVALSDRTLFLGAPERVLDQDFASIAAQVDDYTEQGYRVLALGCTDYPVYETDERGPVEPIALVVISDEVRDDIQETLNAFREQNVGLKVISGDAIETVQAVASQAGIDANRAYVGEQLKNLPEAELDAIVNEVNVFARIEPETKRRIVAALRRQGHHVAMVGDGVNDVPALKEADLAIVMNDGAQVSKDIADIVLLNNAMSTLPLAFEEGQHITQTIYGTMKMFLTKNVYNISFFIFALFMALPFPTTPVQISWAAFGTTNVPAGLMSMGFLKPEPVKRFRRDVLDHIIISGAIGAISLILIYMVTLAYTQELAISRNTVTLFFCLYGIIVALNTCGIDITRPRTLLNYPRIIVVTVGLTGGAVVAASFFPAIFEFRWPPLEIMGFAFTVFLLAMALVGVGMRKRGLLHSFYGLLQRDDA